MQTNNNPVVEIGVILIALGFIAAGTTLLALHTIDLNVAIILWTLAGSVAGINVALKAPSPTQQQLLAQALQAQLVQAPAPPQGGSVIAPAPAPVVQIPFNTTSSMPFGASSLGIPQGTSMPQAIMTTQNMPTVKPQ